MKSRQIGKVCLFFSVFSLCIYILTSPLKQRQFAQLCASFINCDSKKHSLVIQVMAPDMSPVTESTDTNVW